MMGLRTVIAIAGLVVPAMLAPPASAQNRAEILERLEAVEEQLKALGETKAPDAPAADANSGSMLADLSVRLDALDRQIRDLTGMIEELQFAQRQAEISANLLRQEVTVRIEKLEEGGVLSAGEGAADGAGAADNATGALAAGDTAASGEAVVLPPDAEPAEAFRYAFAFVRKGDLEQAATALRTFVDTFPDDALAVNARFWLGKTLLQKGEPAAAGQEFLNIYEKHADHEKAPESLIEFAAALQALGDSAGACDALAIFTGDYPDSGPVLKDKARNAGEDAGCENAGG